MIQKKELDQISDGSGSKPVERKSKPRAAFEDIRLGPISDGDDISQGVEEALMESPEGNGNFVS
jgi:hypothetical protein